MTYELRYNNLITVASNDTSRSSIYWLRLLCDAPSVVAIVTEVPLNPGRPMPENEDKIRSHIELILGASIRQLTFYRVLPRGYPLPESPVVLTKARISISLDLLETSLGLPLPPLPENKELRTRVLELGSAAAKHERRTVFEAVSTANLPPPHNPYRCAHRSRFNNMREEDRWADASEAGSRFISSLSTEDAAACWWHQAADWAIVANESVRVVETVGRLMPEGNYRRAARQAGLSDKNRPWLISLFEEPIIVTGGGYTDGQHRSCALRLSGAPRVAAVTGYENVAIRTNDWQYMGDG